MLDRFHYGVCYYPEAWDPSRHASDIARIADCGFHFVRLGEGAWSYWEPREGEFQFDLFDNVIDLCRRHKLKVILGTPTYAGPAWIAARYPEVLRWDFNRVPMKHGSRRSYNYTSPKYLELSDRIVTALAEHYRGEKQVIGWQLDNEFNCHMDVSYAPSDTLAFRKWLRGKYHSLDALNRAWGTSFWSQTYTDWDEIDLPHPTATHLNPSVLLDESRFISDCVVRFAKRQADILRRANGGWFITHNALFNNVNGPDLVKSLDFFCHDHYPLFWKEGDWTSYAWPLVQARSLSFPFGILEQQSGPGGQMQYLQRSPRPGQIRLWAMQSICHGARLLSYFRWRTCPYGSEQHWHGLLDQDDQDGRRLDEARQVGAETAKLPREFFDAAPVKRVAVLRDFDNDNNDRRINTFTRSGHWEQGRWLRAFGERHVPVDHVWPGDDLAGYRILVAPHLRIIDEALVKRMTAFVRAGGTLVLGALSGVYDRNLHVVQQPRPGLLRDLVGVEVEDWTTVPEGESFNAHTTHGLRLKFDTFVERLRPTSAVPVAQWVGQDTLLSERPAMTLNKVGKGAVLYLGGYCPFETVQALCQHLMSDIRLHPLVEGPPEVEAIARQGEKHAYLCLLNHSSQAQLVAGVSEGKGLLSGLKWDKGVVELEPYGVAIVRVPAEMVE